jgi:hypothetical protein
LLGRSDIYHYGRIYMRRWKGRWPDWFLGLRVHNITDDDADWEFHTHPFWFLSFIGWRGYREWRPVDPKNPTGPRYSIVHKAPAIVFRRADDAHRIELLDGSVWTFVIRGPVRLRPDGEADWGFWTKSGLVPHDVFIEQRKQAHPTPVEFRAPTSH